VIFVFGSNREGRHSKGAALTARQKHGAIYGQAEGRQGNSYAIVTKELRKAFQGSDYGPAPVTLYEVAGGVMRFIAYAHAHPEERFEVTRIGCGLAGFEEEEIAPLFKDAPPNCHLPNGWR